MKRVGFLLKVRSDKLEEYKQHHKAVWPEMLDALRRTGWHNYSLYLRDDGLLVGYVETPSIEKAVAGMSVREVNARWQKEMGEFFEALAQKAGALNHAGLRKTIAACRKEYAGKRSGGQADSLGSFSNESEEKADRPILLSVT